jgi:hypothetical protein
MQNPPVIVLHTPLAQPAKLDEFVEDCVRRGIGLIAVHGPGAALIEDTIDEILVGDGEQDPHFIVTSSHAEESLEDVLEFAALWDGGSPVEEVEL